MPAKILLTFPQQPPAPAFNRTWIYYVFPSLVLTFLGHRVYYGDGSTSLNSHLDSIQSISPHINWWTCPDVPATQCAFLTVPRDYANPNDNDTVSLFLRKVPATVPQKDYLGSIIFNPGGPGGSGGGYAATIGFALRTIVSGRYDIVGFDPRGVNMTVPPLNCYQSEAHGLNAMYKQTLLGLAYDARGPHSLPTRARAASENLYAQKLDATFEAVHLACQTRGNVRMIESLSTALVVQDMEQIVQALGEDGLNYWGFSFGTILGSTFAAMRPHLVKRMILDGVSNAESYHKNISQWGLDGLVDSPKVLSAFFDYCADAGPNRCAWAKTPDATPATPSSLRARLENLYDGLRNRPMPVPMSHTGPGILTASDAKFAVLMGLYVPSSWPSLAEDLLQAEIGNPQPLYEVAYATFAGLLSKDLNENVFNRYMEKYLLGATTSSIMCGDSEPAGWGELGDYIQYVHAMGSVSPIGENWALLPGACRNWKFRAIQRYNGPWAVVDGLNKTRFPIVYASLDADLVSPLSAAQHMVKAFGNESASLLVQEGFGHTTMASPSLCAMKAFRNYFLAGQVPVSGTVCKAQHKPFPANNAEFTQAFSVQDRELWEASKQLGSIPLLFRPPR